MFRHEDAMTQSVVELFTLMVIITVISIWLMVKAIELIARVMIAHPENRLLWGLLLSSIILLVISSIAAFQLAVLDTLTGISVTLLLLVAKVAEVYYSQLM